MVDKKLQRAPESAKRKKFALLPVLDLYILKEFMIPLTVLFMAFIILFIIGDIFNDLKDFLEVKASFKVMFTYFLLKLPSNLRFILPISLLLACMYAMANFGKNMEVTAMRASGISLLRCGGSIYFVALIVTGINFWFNERLVPESERKAKILRDKTINPDRMTERHNMLQYRSTDNRRTWLFSYFDSKGVQKDVILKKYHLDSVTAEGLSGKRLLWDIKAQEAEYMPDQKAWEFREVEITPYDSKGFMPGRPYKFDVIDKTTVFGKEYPEVIRTLPEALGEITEVPANIMNSVKPPEELPSWVILELIRKTHNMSKRCKNLYLTIFFYRLAFPWSCFLAVFLGVPLAAKNERSGVMLSIIIAVVVIVIYQLMSHLGLILGKQGFLNPVLAGLGPTVAFVIYGWYNVIRQSG
jgi:LPS export ABC transporter permease LptG